VNKKVIIPIGLLLLSAGSFRSAQNQLEEIQKDFQRSFDKALEERSVGFVESARERISAEKTRLWNAIQEEVKVELSILGVNLPWTMTLPSLSMGVECVCEQAKRYDTHPLLLAMPEQLAGVGDAALLDQLMQLLIDQGLGRLEDTPCPSCSGFEAFEEDKGCQTLSIEASANDKIARSLRDLERAVQSTTAAKRALRKEFDGRISLLPRDIRERARQLLESPNAVNHEVVTKTTRTALGNVIHQVNEPQANFQFVEDEIAILTSTVRLPQLYQPWRSKYPTRNNCEYQPWNCSKIEVEVPTGQDYLIVIKDRNDRTVNHGYVRAGTTGSFEIDNGSYKTYFITGIGWNAAKLVPCKSCGELHGYFNSSVGVTKSNLESLKNNVLTYTMTMSQFGNFTPQGSSLEEAL
jgi:hypothetical protein